VSVKRLFAPVLFAVSTLAAQTTLVVDRRPSFPASGQRIERPDGGFLGDSFRIGAKGEVWMIDAIRVWFLPLPLLACGTDPGDAIEEIKFLGALDNPPVPGQPTCDCHALMTLAIVPLERGSSRPRSANAALSMEGHAWRLDVKHMRWSVPGDADAVFSVRAAPRNGPCPVESNWSLATAPAKPGFHLHLLDKKGVPAGLDEAASERSIAIQVWASRWK
jgi:hypothetical protein